MATEAEELEEFVALGASDVFRDMSLRGLIRVNARKVLSPRVAQQTVVGLPLLSVLIHEGVTTTVDAIEVVVAVSALDEVAITVGSGGGEPRRRTVGSGGGI